MLLLLYNLPFRLPPLLSVLRWVLLSLIQGVSIHDTVFAPVLSDHPSKRGFLCLCLFLVCIFYYIKHMILCLRYLFSLANILNIFPSSLATQVFIG